MCTCIWTWKECQWIMRTLACKHKIWGKNWLYLRPYLKAFPVFNVLKTCREYFLTIDLGIVEFIKKFIERFLEKCEIFRHGTNYRIFSIKRPRRLFKTWPQGPGVYLKPAFNRGPAFINEVKFSSFLGWCIISHSLRSVRSLSRRDDFSLGPDLT